MTTKYQIGRKLAYLRSCNHIERWAMADKLNMSTYHYKCVEADLRPVDIKTVETVSNLFQVPITYFLSDEDYENAKVYVSDLTKGLVRLSKNDHDELVKFAEYLFSK